MMDTLDQTTTVTRCVFPQVAADGTKTCGCGLLNQDRWTFLPRPAAPPVLPTVAPVEDDDVALGDIHGYGYWGWAGW
jgi:hypothetical protein